MRRVLGSLVAVDCAVVVLPLVSCCQLFLLAQQLPWVCFQLLHAARFARPELPCAIVVLPLLPLPPDPQDYPQSSSRWYCSFHRPHTCYLASDKL